MPSHTNNFQITIGGINATRHIPFPIKWNDLLDERLDEARISVKQAKTKSFEPLTDVTAVFTDEFGNSITKNYLISNDYSLESPPGSGRYDHEIVLIEQTKYLEGFLCDTLTFTNDLGRNYTDGAIAVNGKGTRSGTGGTTDISIAGPEQYKTPLKVGDVLTIAPWKYFEQIGYGYSEATSYVEVSKNGVSLGKDLSSIVLEAATYQIRYYLDYWGEVAPVYYKDDFTFQMQAVENTDPLPKWTIKTVIERLLAVVETRREGDPQRFTLDPEIADKLDAILAPEFAFTSNTLKEALDQIGGFIHAIPRLNGSVITFDFLGGTEMSNAATYTYSYDAFTRDIEDFATKIDSRVDNLVNVLDDENGTVTEPYADNFKTLRTEELYVRIQDSNVVIETKYPIQDVKEVRVYNDNRLPPFGVDITPYVFEEADYSRMSSIGETYPDSKAYAIYFTQGERNIKGLNFQVPDAVGGGALVNYAIVNILKALDVNIDLDPQMLVRVTYIPIYSARVEQTKSCIKGLMKPRTLAYNQGANLVETRYYGENLKGVIARVGNTERSRTFVGKRLTRIPKVGQLFDEDYYIASVAVEFCPYDYKCTLGLSKDFNRLSQYIGINSQKRYYEVSEKSAYNREINYTDYLLFTRNTDIAAEDTLFAQSLTYFVVTFAQSSLSLYNPVGAVTVIGDENNTSIVLPVVKNAFGNSIVFSFSYEDNFSAGNQSVTVGLEGNNTGYFMQGVAYANVYGRIEKLHVQFHEQQAEMPPNFPNETDGDKFPEGTSDGEVIMETGTRPFIVQKDGREGISFNYQIEFVSDIPSLVIGSAFARSSAYLKAVDQSHAGKLYVLPNRISKFADVIDLTGATFVTNITLLNLGVTDKVVFAEQTAPVSGAAWVIVDGTTNELFVGENTAITEGEAIPLPVMTPRHNIFGL